MNFVKKLSIFMLAVAGICFLDQWVISMQTGLTLGWATMALSDHQSAISGMQSNLWNLPTNGVHIAAVFGIAFLAIWLFHDDMVCLINRFSNEQHEEGV